MKTVEERVMEKLADSRYFTDDEMGYLAAAIEAAEASKTAGEGDDAVAELSPEQLEAIDAIEKEASDLSDEELAEAIKVAAEQSGEAAEAIVEAAEAEVLGEHEKHAEAMEQGYYMFVGFNAAAQEAAAAEQGQKVATELEGRAPALAAALGRK